MREKLSDRLLLRQAEILPWAHDAVQHRDDNSLMANSDRRRIYLRPWRKYRGLTQEELGFRMAGTDGVPVSKSHISGLERGTKQYTQEMLERLATALECEPYHLLIGPPDLIDDFSAVASQIDPDDRARALDVLRAFVAHSDAA